MVKERVFTLETRLNKQDAEYFGQYIGFYCKVYREVWQDYIHGEVLSSKYVTKICHKHNLMKRTVNSIVRDVKGRYYALKELQKQQCDDLKHKIDALGSSIDELKSDIDVLSKQAEKNELNVKELLSYKNKKRKLFSLQVRMLKYQNKVNNMGKLSFGSKEFWFKQYHLEENGFRSHTGWYNQYIRRRDKYIYYVGSSDETCGNQMFQLSYNKDLDYFQCKIRMENNYVVDENKYLYIDVDFKSPRRNELIEMLDYNSSISCRVLRRGRKWYLQVMFSVGFDVLTDKNNGCIGVDFNNGFLAVTETDKHGNIADVGIFELRYHGGGNKAKTEMEGIIKNLVTYCRGSNKALAIEDLSFSKKKSGTLRRKNKWYNQMLHRLDYSRFQQLCDNCTAVYGVEFIKVNPAYTTKIARQKYCNQRKLNIHIGASYVIARRGQGFKDKLLAY